MGMTIFTNITLWKKINNMKILLSGKVEKWKII